MLKAIVFDFDGVIVDSEPTHYRAFIRVAEKIGVKFTYDEYLETYIGYDDRDAFRVMLGLPAGKEGSATEHAKVGELVEAKADAFEAVVAEGVDTIPGMVDLIREAGEKMPIAIASGATKRDIELILGGLKLRHLFKTIVTADDVERSKPDPASYALAAQKLAKIHADLALEPGHCLAIEDTAAGIESARGAGLMTLGITTTGTADKLHRAMRVEPDPASLNLAKLVKWYG